MKVDSETIRRLAADSPSVEEFQARLKEHLSAGEIKKYDFDHVAIPVSDIQGTLSWYQAIFDNVEVLYQDEEWAFIETGGIKLAFVLEGVHPAHLAFEVSIDTLYELVEIFNVPMLQEREDTLSVMIVGGPDSICIEFVCYLEDFED